MQFPRSVQFTVQATAMRKLRESMPLAGAPKPPPPDRLARWRRELTACSDETLKQRPFHPEWRRVLPYLVVPGEEEHLRARAAYLVRKYFSELRPGQLHMVAAHTADGALITQMQNTLDVERLPPWVRVFAGGRYPFSASAPTAWSREGTFAGAARWFGTPAGTLVHLAAQAAVARATPEPIVREHLAKWLLLIESGDRSPVVRVAMLDRLAEIVEPNPRARATGAWYDAGVHLLGAGILDAPLRWDETTARSQELARAVARFREEVRRAVVDFFSNWNSEEARLSYWTGKANLIQDYHVFRYSTGAIMMRIGGRYLVEFGQTGNACYSYDESEWATIRRIHSPRIGQLKLKHKWQDKDHWLPHRSGWQRRFDGYIRKHCM